MNRLSKRVIFFLSLLFAAMIGVGVLLVRPACAQDSALQMVFDRTGISALNFQGDSLLSNGLPAVKQVDFSDYENNSIAGPTTPSSTRVDAKLGQITATYPWGTVAYAYKAVDTRLYMTATVSNTSDHILSGLLLQLLAFKLPGGSTGFDQGFRRAHNVEEPSVVSVGYPNGLISLVNEQMGQPLYIGYPESIDEKNPNAVYPVLVSTTANPVFPRKSPLFPNIWLDFPKISRPIYPGESDTYRVSLRFGERGARVEEIAGDAFHRFAEAYPHTLVWKDRRPVGMFFMGGPERVSKTDPRGFYIQTKDDINSPEGRAEFKQQMMEAAARTIQNLKAMNCQGVLFWDLEGYQFPATYIGDPRSLSPEVNGAIDDFMKAFRDAGLRVGLTLRPQFPGRMLFNDGVDQLQLLDPSYILEQKVAYAKKRWGCTLFYVDSDCNFDEYGHYNDEAAYAVMPATVFEKVAKANPDVLFIPEHSDTRYYAYTSSWREVRQGFAITQPRITRVYPDAFSFIRMQDGPVQQYWSQLVAAVKRGDIMVVGADSVNQDVLKLMKEAQK